MYFLLTICYLSAIRVSVCGGRDVPSTVCWAIELIYSEPALNLGIRDKDFISQLKAKYNLILISVISHKLLSLVFCDIYVFCGILLRQILF